MHLAWSLYCIIHYSLIIQSCYSHCSTILPILCLIVWILCETVFLVPRPLWQINIVSELTAGRSSDLSKTWFWQILHEILTKSSKFQHCTRSQGLPLNTPSKEIVDQACLINYVGCNEILKCAGFPTLRCPFCCDLQVLTGESIRSKQFQMASFVELLSSFNFHSCKGDMEI